MLKCEQMRTSDGKQGSERVKQEDKFKRIVSCRPVMNQYAPCHLLRGDERQH